MEENVNVPTVRSSGVRYGLVMGILGIIIFVAFSILNLDMTGPLRWISLPINAVIIFLAHQYYKENGDGFMTYAQGLGISFWAGLVSSAISSVFTYIFVKFIDGSMMEMIRNKQIEEMEQKGMSDEQMEQALKFMEMFSSPEMILIFGLLGGIFMIFIIGLIISIFTQKTNPQPSAF